mgnify:CR=1 FL=1
MKATHLTMKKLSIIIPCYNEKNHIPLILSHFAAVIETRPIEVILVNNGSTDGSEKIFNEICSHFPFVRSVYVPINQGYGYGILQGLKAATGDYLGWTHADMQTDPQDVIKAFDIVASKSFPQNIFVKGNRKGRSLFDRFFTVGMSYFETVYLHKWLWDINAQPNIFHRSFFEKWQNPPHDFSLDLYALYMAKKYNLTVMRFPVQFSQRIHGASSWNTGLQAKWKFIKRTINFSCSLKTGL